MRAQREVWGSTLTELATTDPRIILLDADLANSTRADIFAAAHPDRFVEVGIAEQNMVGVAAGLAAGGYRPWVSTFGVFLTQRALDQVRMLVSQTGASVRLAAGYAGLLNGRSGKTHQDIADLAIMRSMPNMTVLAPADEYEAAAVIRWAADHEGPVYVRLARDGVPAVFDADYVFTLGQPVVVRPGGRIVLVSTGVQTSRTVAAADILEAKGIDVGVVHVPSLKPLDEDALCLALQGAERIYTVEEHSMIGGLGGLVSEIVAARSDIAPTVRIGLADQWSESGPDDFLLAKYGLSAARVADAVGVDLVAQGVAS
ncbi:transketolase family protein [Microbacterium sp. NPDC055357]